MGEGSSNGLKVYFKFQFYNKSSNVNSEVDSKPNEQCEYPISVVDPVDFGAVV